MLLGDGDSRPNSIRFDIVTCPPLGKKKPPTIFYRAVSYGREVKVMFLSFSFRSVFSGFLLVLFLSSYLDLTLLFLVSCH